MKLTDLVAEVQHELEARAEPNTKAWWDRYLRNAIEFRGVKMDATRKTVATVLRGHGMNGETASTKGWRLRCWASLWRRTSSRGFS